MATETEVDLAFRFLLDRPPTEGEAREWMAAPFDALRPSLMATDAFRTGLPAHAVQMPLDLPLPSIIWQTDTATAAALLARVQARWTRLGEERPFWSIDTRPEFAPDQIAINRPSFDASGKTDLDVDLAMLARYGHGPATLKRVFEFGCGVGRITQHLARSFASVGACDVSPPHLGLARQAAGASVQFSLAAVPDFGMRGAFDLWLSTLTLQHNPPPVMTMILRRMFSLLAPGGIALFQLPTQLTGYTFDPAQYLAAPDAPEVMEIHALPQPVVFALAAEAGCVALEVREDGLVWPPTACLSNRFMFVKRPAGVQRRS